MVDGVGRNPLQNIIMENASQTVTSRWHALGPQWETEQKGTFSVTGRVEKETELFQP